MEHNVAVMRLRNIAKHLIEEKEKHKQICDFSSNCPHRQACYGQCYFTDKSFVAAESESEESDNEDEDNTDQEEYSEMEEEHNQSEETNKFTCKECNFEAKNVCGLKIHMKSEHKFTCNLCDYKTTTQMHLKKHIIQLHQ